MFEFHVQPEVWDRFPGMALVCGSADNIDNRGPNRRAADMLSVAQDRVQSVYDGEDFGSLAQVEVWRRVQGKSYPAAHAALAKRVISGKPLRSINGIVDAYSAMSLDLFAQGIAAPIGAWCTKELNVIKLIKTKGSERFVQLGTSDPVTVDSEEIAYADETESELITRHFVWRQSNLGAIRPETTSIFIVSELIPPFADEAPRVLATLLGTFAGLFEVELQTAVLSAPATRWEV